MRFAPSKQPSKFAAGTGELYGQYRKDYDPWKPYFLSEKTPADG